MLYCQSPPPCGGDTIWASTVKAYDSLSSRMKSYLEGLDAVHTLTVSPGFQRKFMRESELENFRQFVVSYPPAIHPVVLRQPETRQPLLFVNETYTSHVVDIDRAESDAVLGVLFEQIRKPEHQIRFKWERGSVAIWDNHYLPHARTMHRVAIEDDDCSSWNGGVRPCLFSSRIA